MPDKRLLTRWNWREQPEAPHSWTDPARRVVLVEPDLWDGEMGAENVRAAAEIATLEKRGTIFVEPTRDPGRMARPTYLPLLPGIVPALLARTQADVNALMPALLRVPATLRALLIEPRETVNIGQAFWERCVDHGLVDDCACEVYENGATPGRLRRAPGIDWVIVRGGAEPLHPAWVRALRDQAAAAGVPFAFLGWGAWIPHDDHAPREVNGYSRRKRAWLDGGGKGPMPEPADGEDVWWSDGTITGWGTISIDGTYWDQTTPWTSERGTTEWSVCRVGAARSGRLLDGREHLASPWGELEVSDG